MVLHISQIHISYLFHCCVELSDIWSIYPLWTRENKYLHMKTEYELQIIIYYLSSAFLFNTSRPVSSCNCAVLDIIFQENFPAKNKVNKINNLYAN